MGLKLYFISSTYEGCFLSAGTRRSEKKLWKWTVAVIVSCEIYASCPHHNLNFSPLKQTIPIWNQCQPIKIQILSPVKKNFFKPEIGSIEYYVKEILVNISAKSRRCQRHAWNDSRKVCVIAAATTVWNHTGVEAASRRQMILQS